MTNRIQLRKSPAVQNRSVPCDEKWDEQCVLGVLLIQRTIILFWACCDQLSYITSWGRLLQYYPLFQLHLTFSQHLRDKSISKGYNEAVNVHSATKTAAINNLKNVEIEAEVHKKTLLDYWHFYTGIQKVYKCCRDGTCLWCGFDGSVCPL